MLLKDFFQIFPDEVNRIDYFRQIREDVGITCPKCGYTEHKSSWPACLRGRNSPP